MYTRQNVKNTQHKMLYKIVRIFLIYLKNNYVNNVINLYLMCCIKKRYKFLVYSLTSCTFLSNVLGSVHLGDVAVHSVAVVVLFPAVLTLVDPWFNDLSL